MTPREITDDEVRYLLLAHIHELVRYWGSSDERVISQPKTIDERLNGLALSILAVLDGSAVALPGFVVAPHPHPDDRTYNRGRGKPWFPDTPDLDHDIAGSLHEHFHESHIAACQVCTEARAATRGVSRIA